jgi:hypothetical protein
MDSNAGSVHPRDQRALEKRQIEEFYVDCFAVEQANHFERLMRSRDTRPEGVVTDIGGGVGYFAREIRRRTGSMVRVIDTDSASVNACNALGDPGIAAVREDALKPSFRGDEAVACFNLVLHHLVSATEQKTRALQVSALRNWRGHTEYVFVNEYIYDSFLGDATSWLIFAITRSKMLSMIGRIVGTFVPSLRANTFGVGVRFRSHDGWLRVFEEAGFVVVDVVEGEKDDIPLPQRLLLTREVRRDSFLLAPAVKPNSNRRSNFGRA